MSNSLEMDREQLERLDQASLIEFILAMQQQVAVQQALIQELQAQLAKDSRNSSKPPSSDGLKKPGRQSLRQSGKRPRGGQPGHKGQTLMQAADPQHVIQHTLTGCPHCQTELTAVAAKGRVRRQVFDVPPVGIEVTEHQVEIKQCPGCGAQVKGAFPAQVTQPTQYGPRLKAQACYLHNYQLIPLARTTELLTDFYGQAPSEAVALNASRQLAHHTQASLESIQQQLIAAAVIHCDESGMRVAGETQWLHVASSAKLTHLLLDIKAEVASGSETLTALPPDRLAHYEAAYDSLIAQGVAANPSPKQPNVRPRGRPKRSPPLNLLRRLRKHKSGVLAFMFDFHIPFDNNQAERDVRMLKVQQKVSGAFRTQAGADTFCAFRSYISTARKHGLNAIDAIGNAFLGQPFFPPLSQA